LLLAILIELQSIKKQINSFCFSDPLFPAFDKGSIEKAKYDFILAKQEFDRLQAVGLNNAYDSLDQFNREYVQAKITFSTTQENMHRMIQANISALNGKKILPLQEEHRKWYTSRVFEDPQDVIAEIEKINKRKKL
jgi:hypothetical protein